LEISSSTALSRFTTAAAALLFFLLLSPSAFGGKLNIDYPHNETYLDHVELPTIPPTTAPPCKECHLSYGSNAEYINEVFYTYDPTKTDYSDSLLNQFCLSCHSDGSLGPVVVTHSSDYIDESYGQWTVDCVACHWPHEQLQFRAYGASTYLTTGVSENVTTTTLTDSTKTWTPDEFAGMILIPNIDEDYYNYKIESNTDTTITVYTAPGINGDIDLTKASIGNTYAVISGYLINTEIDLGKIRTNPANPDKTGVKPVEFLMSKAGYYTSSGPDYVGICEVCHTRTAFHRNNDAPPDPLDPFEQYYGDPTKPNRTHNIGLKCTLCHMHKSGFKGMGGGAHFVHVYEANGPEITCDNGDWGCHGTNFQTTAQGEILFSDGQPFATTTVCDNCHSKAGADIAKSLGPDNNGDGKPDRIYWSAPGVWDAAEKCGSCHDNQAGEVSPAMVPNGPSLNFDGFSAVEAPNVWGDDDALNPSDVPTYGFLTTGHGASSASLARLSWQDDAASGNPGPNKQCDACHDLSSQHFGSANSRLKAGWENDVNNSNCYQCHDAGGSAAPADKATAAPFFYTDFAAYNASAHGQALGNVKCSGCHDVHGAVGNYPAMTKGNQEGLCYQCHADGQILNGSIAGYRGTHDGGNDLTDLVDSTASFPGSISGGSVSGWTVYNLTDGSKGTIPSYDYAVYGGTSVPAPLSGGTDNNWDVGDEYFIAWADDIQEAFAAVNKHDLGTAFVYNGKNYTLECVSCHNVHVVTGKYWDADLNLTPVTKFPPDGNLQPWGDSVGEKMDDFANTGTYRTPSSDIFSGSQLPDYATFCLSCHGQAGSAPFGIDWAGDPHGKQSANQPNGYGVCPDWWTCGKASGWSGDECISDEATCWPIVVRGKGDELWSRGAYNHEERIAGANFTLSCTDCHEAHGGSDSSMLRANPNNGAGSWVWNTMCNNCHYYYSDWHAGMSCGNASCHVENSIHRMANNSGSGGTRSFNPDLVLQYSFQSNLTDSAPSSWQMDGAWSDAAGTFSAGKVGNAVWFNDNHIQAGTTDITKWANSEGDHGNTAKLMEMKYNTTLEAWVYPTDDTANDRQILIQHNFGNGGGYNFLLTKVDGTYRAALKVNVNLGGTWELMSPGQCGWTWSPHSDKWHWHDNWDSDCNGERGAYSSVGLPLNKWTHIAATFDTALPDRDPNDPTVGRIRIYVNGEDVTTSNSSDATCYAQPGAGEDHITPWSDMNQWARAVPPDAPASGPDGLGQYISVNVKNAYSSDPAAEGNPCYQSQWCGNEMFVGGYSWDSGTYYIGGLDELKIWNVTKDATYFTTNIDPMAGPYLVSAEGVIGSSTLTATFSEGVYTGTGAAGALVLGDFVLTDSDDGRTITGVTHTAGSATAELTLSAPMDATNDFYIDTLAAASGQIYDEYDNAADTSATTITMISSCPPAPIIFDLNEAPGSAYVFDGQNILVGEVVGAGALTGNEFSGDGAVSGRYINFPYNAKCLQATTALTLEARIKPSNIGAANYVNRVLARDGGGNYQMTVWRNTGWATYNPPDNEASIALWAAPLNTNGGNAWKVSLTNYTGGATGSENECPIVSDHWYQVKAVWNTSRLGGTAGQPFSPVDIFVDDQGTDGLGAGENWTGFINCTDRDQSLVDQTLQRFYTDDEIRPNDSSFAIGVNRNTLTGNLFDGLIDWIKWQDAVDYSGVQGAP